MTRVVHLTSVHTSHDVRIYLKECRSLADEGFDVHLIAPAPIDKECDGVRIWSVPEGRRRLARMTRTTYTTYRRAADIDAHLYHIHDPELLPWALRLQHRRRVPVIYDVHEYVAQDVATKAWMPPLVAGLVAPLVEKLEGFVSRRVAGIVAVNPHMAARFRLLNPNVGTVANYPHRAMAEAAPDRETVIPYSAVYLGALDQDRGLDTVVAAMNIVRARHAAATCRVLGELDASGQPHLTSVGLASLGIEFQARIPHRHLPATVARHPVGWIPWTAAPAYVYGTPTKLFDYMAAGVPVVGSDLVFVRQIIEENDCGIVVPSSDPAAHAAALFELWDDPARARRLGENGRRAVLERLNWESQIPALLQVYRRALGTQAKGVL